MKNEEGKKRGRVRQCGRLVGYLVGSPDAEAEVNAASVAKLPVEELPSSGSNLWPLRERDRASAGTVS